MLILTVIIYLIISIIGLTVIIKYLKVGQHLLLYFSTSWNNKSQANKNQTQCWNSFSLPQLPIIYFNDQMYRAFGWVLHLSMIYDTLCFLCLRHLKGQNFKFCNYTWRFFKNYQGNLNQGTFQWFCWNNCILWPCFFHLSTFCKTQI